MKTLPRMILVAQKDLPKGKAAAMASHALAAFALKHPGSFLDWNNGHIVILRGDTEKLGMQMLSNYGRWLEEHQRDDIMLPVSIPYREPDMNNNVVSWALLVSNQEELNFTDLILGDLPLL